MTEQVDADLVKDIDQCEGVNSNVSDKLLQLQVSEVKINGNIETGSVTLAGIKILRSKEEIKLKTPKTELYSDYEFINELVAATQNLIHEITEYHNGKSRPESQLDMFIQADDLEVTK